MVKGGGNTPGLQVTRDERSEIPGCVNISKRTNRCVGRLIITNVIPEHMGSEAVLFYAVLLCLLLKRRIAHSRAPSRHTDTSVYYYLYSLRLPLSVERFLFLMSSKLYISSGFDLSRSQAFSELQRRQNRAGEDTPDDPTIRAE